MTDKELKHKAPGGVRGWAWLLLSAGLIWLFVFVAAPRMQEYGPVEQVHGNIRESGIDATALYYTEIQEFSDAEHYLRDARDYSPSKN